MRRGSILLVTLLACSSSKHAASDGAADHVGDGAADAPAPDQGPDLTPDATDAAAPDASGDADAGGDADASADADAAAAAAADASADAAADAAAGCHTPKVIVGGPDCPVGPGCVIATCHGLDYACTCNADGTLTGCKLSDGNPCVDGEICDTHICANDTPETSCLCAADGTLGRCTTLCGP
jgi:hypothetical protein